MAGYLAVTNWNRYQHYKDRSPVWIKLYVDALNNEKLKALPLSTRLLWDQMLLLAATFQNSVPNSPELVGNLTGIDSELCREGIALLVKGRWLREKQTRRSASRVASVEESKSKSKDARARERCPECELALPLHAADCSKRLRLASGAA